MTNAVPFTNNIGQVIQPGDEVVIVTTGYSHRVNTCKGTYLGLHKNNGAQCVKQIRTSYYTFKNTGERVPSSFWAEMQAEQTAWISNYVKNNPGSYSYYTDPEYKAIRASYFDQIETQYYMIDRRTTLQRNRIYKIAS